MDVNNTLTLNGLSPYWDSKSIIRALQSQDVDMSKIQVTKLKKKCFCVFKFQTQDDLINFRKKFGKHIVIKNKKLALKEGHEGIDLQKLNKMQKVKKKEKVQKQTNNTNIIKQVAQYYDKDLKEQQQLKQKDCFDKFVSLRENVLKKPCCRIAPRQAWLKEDKNKQIFQNIVGATDLHQNYYRNKTEYTISVDEKNQVKVGFILNVKNDYPEVDNSPEIPIINPKIYDISIQIQIFLQTLQNDQEFPNLKVFNRETKEGCFRSILIRHSEATKQIIIMLICKFIDPEQKIHFIEQVTKFCENLYLHDFSLVSFIVEHHNDLSNALPNIKENQIYIKGNKDYVIEEMCDMQFKVPIGGFFQVNPKLAENLFQQIFQMIEFDENTILLDICAGTGTFGLVLGQKCKEIIFIECNQESCGVIKDNFELNEKAQLQEKSQIYAEKIEDCIQEITQKLSGKGMRVVAIVDPPRAGLHPSVIKNLRTFIGVDELIYISCSFSQARANLEVLSCEQSKNCRGPPFSPIKVIPFDIFPNTHHYETLIYMKRLYEQFIYYILI